MKITLAIWTFVQVPRSTFADRERKIMTAFFIGDSQIVASLPPFGAMGQDAAPTRAKLSEEMSEFMTQSPIDFGRMFEQPRLQRD